MKFGGELRRDQIKVSFINRPNGDFTFGGTQYTGNAAADFLLGFPQQYPPGDRRSEPRRLVVGLRDLRAGRIPRSRRVTLNYGVRYEVNQPFAETPGSSERVPSGAAVDACSRTRRRGLVYPGDAGVPRGTYPTDKNNVAPRLAAVWDVRGDGRTAVRARVGPLLRHAAGAGRLLPERHARAAVPAADRGELPAAACRRRRSRTRCRASPARPASRPA